MTGSALIVLVSDKHSDQESLHNSDIAVTISQLLNDAGISVDGSIVCPAEATEVRSAVNTAVIGGVDLVLTIGGVGIHPRDIVPSITEALLDMRILGIEERLRYVGYQAGSVTAAMSRGVVGISGSTVIVNICDDESMFATSIAAIVPFITHIMADFSLL